MSYWKRNWLGAGILAVLLAVGGCQGVPPFDAGDPDSYTPPSTSEGLVHGAVNPDVTQENIDETICKSGYTKTIRPSSSYTSKIKKKMIAEQNWEGPAILDHYIPLQGGGHPSDPRNFLLQTPKKSYEKDNAEDQMRDDICDRKIPLRQAQEIMGEDWTKYEERVG